MKIVLALHQFFPQYSAGTEQLCLAVANVLRSNGHQVYIATAVPPSCKITKKLPTVSYRYDGFQITRFSAKNETNHKQSIVEVEYNNLNMHAFFAKYLKQVKPDLIHFFHLARLSSSVINAVVDEDIPAIYTTTDFWFECPAFQLYLPDGTTCHGPDSNSINCLCHLLSLKLPVIKHNILQCVPKNLIKAGMDSLAKLCRGGRGYVCYYKDLMARSDFIRKKLSCMKRILAPTKFNMSRLVDFGIPSQLVKHHPYGIVMPSNYKQVTAKKNSKKLQLGFVGAIQPHKGLHILLESLKLTKDLPIYLKIYGKTINPKYASIIRTLSAGNQRIEYCGIFPNNKFGNILLGIDALVVPSIWHENMPLVVLSAVAHRCPVIVSDVPGLIECVRERLDGFYFSSGNPKALSEIIVQLYTDRSHIDKVHNEKTSLKSIDLYTEELESIYQELTSN